MQSKSVIKIVFDVSVDYKNEACNDSPKTQNKCYSKKDLKEKSRLARTFKQIVIQAKFNGLLDVLELYLMPYKASKLKVVRIRYTGVEEFNAHLLFELQISK